MAGDGAVLADRNDHIDRILAIVRERAGVDFGAYRDGTVQRRIANRMLCAGVADTATYVGLLERSIEETWHLIDRLTIKVSRFYRDRPVFDFLRENILPAWQRRGMPVRIWSAGCARGEEAYTLALLLCEGGVDGTVLGTDLDPAALAAARAGRYTIDAAGELDASQIERCFDRHPDKAASLVVRPEIRARVSFGRHDLTTDAPPGMDFDLVTCRNVLIYLKRPAQQTVLSSLTSALAVEGHLCLGEAEWPDSSVLAQLQPLPRQMRIFRRVAMPHLHTVIPA